MLEGLGKYTPVQVSSMGKINVRKLLALNRNTWNYITFVLKIVNWSYNYLQIIIIIYLKSYNCFEKTDFGIE